jgi:hypothetical protein
MKRPLLVVALLLITLKSYSIIFWQPYPITAAVGVNGQLQRVECSVYDSTLGSWQYFATPYYDDSILLRSNNTGIIAFNTIKHSGQWWDTDTIYGYIIYDQSLHQFMPHIVQYKDPHYYGPDLIRVVDNMVDFSYSCCSGSLYGFDSDQRVYIYDIISHKWEGGQIAGSSSGWSVAGLSFYKGGLLKKEYNDVQYDPSVGMCFFDPVMHDFIGVGNSDEDESGGDQNGFYSIDNQMAGDDETVYAAFSPTSHYWLGGTFTPQGSHAASNNGILFAEQYGDENFCAFDDSLNDWVIDTHVWDYLNTQNLIIKDRVVAHYSYNKTKVYCQVYSPSLHAWVRDSTVTDKIDSLYIDEGTVHWTDTAGVNYFRGYIDGQGWGNYLTPLQLNFQITDMYSSTGYPLIYVRDYSIGNDSTWYTFSDGVETTPGEQNSLWHLFKINGNYSPSFTNGQVCIHAMTTNGEITYCKDYIPECAVSIQSTNACPGTCNATAAITNLTAAAPLSYIWSTGDTISAMLDSLCVGDYNVTVVDANGCSVYHEFHVSELDVESIVSPDRCSNTCNGSIYVLPKSGTVPFNYLWSTGDTTNDINYLCAGTYTLSITDGNLCQKTVPFTVSNTGNPLALTASENYTPICGGSMGVFLYYNFTGGVRPCTITVNPAYYVSADTTTNNISIMFMDDIPGIYTTTVSDAYGCSLSVTDTFFSVPSRHDSLIIYHPTCNTCTDGMIVAIITGGIPPYEIHTYPFTGYNNDTIYNLGPGPVYISIWDNAGCEADYWDTLYVVTSIDEHGSHNLTIQPNPANDYFSIVLPDSEKKFSKEQLAVFNSLGERINVDAELNDKHIKVNSKNFPSGIYLIKLSSDDHIFVGRLMIE